MMNMQSRLEKHRQFWRGGYCDHLLVSFRIGDYFFANKFSAAHKLLVPGKTIEPAMIKPEHFLEDYERMYNETLAIGQSGFFTAEPFVGIPWLEAILGCPIKASSQSFIAESKMADTAQIKGDFTLDNNEWYLKYLEFTHVLVQHAAGRYPVGQPIMRGLSDAFGALAGQEKMIFQLLDHPQESKKLISVIADTFTRVIAGQFELIPAFHDGYAIGFYHVWTPGKCIWFQEDLSSILSPSLFAAYLLPEWQEICSRYDYNAIHLHPSSFHNLDIVLGIEKLQAVEINKDEEGPSIQDLLTVCRRILSKGKRLILWGNLTEDETRLIRSHFAGEPVYLNIVTESIESARRLMRIVE